MGALWKVLVTKKEEKVIFLKVISMQGDGGGFPEDEPFVFSLIATAAYDEFSFLPTSPLGRAFPQEEIYDSYEIAEKAYDFIENSEIYETQNLPWTSEKYQAVVTSRILAKGIKRDDKNWQQLFEEEWKLFCSDKSSYEPHSAIAKYKVRVTDSKWIEHLSEGMIFESHALGGNMTELWFNTTFKRQLGEE